MDICEYGATGKPIVDCERYKDLQADNKRLREALYHECPEKYPDNCEICKGTNLGVRGNENVIDGKVVCDYCHAKALMSTE